MKVDQIVDNEAQYGQDTVSVRVYVSPYQKTYLPVEEGGEAFECVFKAMTIDDGMALDKLAFTKKTTEKKIDISSVDYFTYRMLLLRKNLLVFGGFIPERNNGWIVKDSWEKIKKTNAMILNSILTEYELTTMMGEDEEALLDRQAGILFSTDNGKVMNPAPGVSMYCTLSSIWDKFGISLETLKYMRSSDYAKIRAVMSKESEIMRRDAKK